MNAQRTHVDISFHPATPPAAAALAPTPTESPTTVEPPLEVGPDGHTTAVVAAEAAVKKDFWTAKVVRREALVRSVSLPIHDVNVLTFTSFSTLLLDRQPHLPVEGDLWPHVVDGACG